MNYMSSPGVAVFAGMFPFLFFFLWLAAQWMNPHQHDVPKVATYKIVVGLAILVPLSVCLLVFAVASTAHAVEAKVTPGHPRAPVADVAPAPNVDPPAALPKRTKGGR